MELRPFFLAILEKPRNTFFRFVELENLSVNPYAKARIAVVDDRSDAAYMIAVFLRGEGYENVSTHCEPRKFLQEIVKGPVPHLLLTDYDMPEMNGLELAEAIQTLYPAVRIILISGDPQHVMQQSGCHYPVFGKEIAILKTLLTAVESELAAINAGT